MRYNWGAAGAGYRGQVENLYEGIKTTFPAPMRWGEINDSKQQPGEMVADHSFRLTPHMNNY